MSRFGSLFCVIKGSGWDFRVKDVKGRLYVLWIYISVDNVDNSVTNWFKRVEENLFFWDKRYKFTHRSCG